MSVQQPFSWISAALSHTGRVRQANEDACLSLPERGIWAVADGMGGHAAGQLASQTVIDHLTQLSEPGTFEGFIEKARQALGEANTKLRREARSRSESIIGSTVAALLGFDCYAACLWAGDSRIYRLRGGRFELLSRDHSHAEELVRQGTLAREEAERHPAAHSLTRAVGAADEFELDSRVLELEDEDLFLVCSDGLYRELSDETIASCLMRNESVTATHKLVETAVEKGGRDNISVVVVQTNDTQRDITRTVLNPVIAGLE